MLTNRITSILIPLLADTLERGNNEGKLKIESPALCAKFIIFGSLGVLNSGDNVPSENIKNNLGRLQNFISDILHFDVGKGVTDER
jgi:hypothetical protein